MNLDPKKRCTAEEALDSPWLKNIDYEKIAPPKFVFFHLLTLSNSIFSTIERSGKTTSLKDKRNHIRSSYAELIESISQNIVIKQYFHIISLLDNISFGKNR